MSGLRARADTAADGVGPMCVVTGALALLVIGLAPFAWAEAAQRPVETLVWLGALVIANGFALSALGNRLEVSLSAPLAVALAVLFSPALAAVVNALGCWSPRELRGQASPLMSVFNRAQTALAVGGASLAASLAPWGLIGDTVLAAGAHATINTVLVAAAFILRRGESPGRALREAGAPFPRFSIDFAITSLLALVVVVAYDQLAYWAIALLALPLWLGWSALRSSRDAEDRAAELVERVRELETLHDAARDLLTARDAAQAAAVGRDALAHALDRCDVDVSLAHPAPAAAGGRRVLAVHGVDSAAVLVPADLDERSVAVAESVAGMLGLALVRQQLERELAAVERARAELAAQILDEAVRERSRLAVELHDDVLPQLSGAQMAADNTRAALEAGSPQHADELAAQAGDAVSAGIRRVREVLDAIQRQIIVPGGLGDGLRAALDELKVNHGVDGELLGADDVHALPFAVEILLLETARGCLANVAHHASAEHVRVGVEADLAHVRLSITDDGKGFDPGSVAEGHHGLALMRQRAELARGSFTVSSTPGRGTRVDVEVPR